MRHIIRQSGIALEEALVFMEAIVMAGGAGTRLRPLTEAEPKPLVPVVNTPMMGHILGLLRKHRFTDVAVTLGYRGEQIESRFGSGVEHGLRLRYTMEETPRGTAGGVRLALSQRPPGQSKERFLVISGDAITDMDLTALVEFHVQSGALATLALTRVTDPSSFGVVECAEDGRIVRFIEKPAPGEAFSNLVNTGIYVMEPEILNWIPAQQPWDFGRNLFPQLLAEGMPVFGWETDGYWCDVGTLGRYLSANLAAAWGKVKLELPGTEVDAGVRLGTGARVDAAATLGAPSVIGCGSIVGAGAQVAWSVIGAGVHVPNGARIARSVVLPGAEIGEGEEVTDAICGPFGRLAITEAEALEMLAESGLSIA